MREQYWQILIWLLRYAGLGSGTSRGGGVEELKVKILSIGFALRVQGCMQGM